MEKRKVQTVWEKEWAALVKKESRILTKYEKENLSIINKKLELVVPNQLQEKLNLAFYKSFRLVFEKGSKVIETTYSKGKQENEYKIREFAVDIKKNRKSAKAFSKQASAVSTRNLILSGVEGVGFGILGVGIVDIPLFTGVILKSIYEIALSFGFSYDSKEERLFILKIIQASLAHGDDIIEADYEINQWIVGKGDWDINPTAQIRVTADALSRELLYMKFLQGIPIVGVLGGLTNVSYLKKISDYASMKYKRRFLINKL